MKSIPCVKAVMTPFPYWVDKQTLLQEAIALMRGHDIRHLPVKDQGKLYGVLADRDIKNALAWREEQGGDVTDLRVEDVSVRKIYTVGMEEPLDNVLMHMAEHHIGSAVVVKGERLAGVFTTNDACREFGKLLRYQFRPGHGDDAA